MRLIAIPLMCATLLLGGWTALDWSEVAAVATGTVPDAWAAAGLNTGLVSYWAMRTNTSTTVFDEYGTNTGTAVNGVLFGSAYGKRDNGAGFDGVNDYVRALDSASLSVTGLLTISAWQKTSVAVGHYVSKYSSANARSYGFYVETGTGKPTLVLSSLTGSFAGVTATASTSITNGAWRHVVAVYDSTNVFIYIDGTNQTLALTGTVPASIADSSANLHIGVDAALAQYFNGSIDEVAIWNRALSSNEVYQIYNTPLYAPYKP